MSDYFRENKFKVLLLILASVICLFIYDTMCRYYSLTAYQRHNSLYITLEVEDSANIFKIKDQKNLSLYIYQNKWRWIAGIPCFYKYIDTSPAKSMALYDWKILSMEAGIVKLTNNGKEMAISIKQCL